MADDPSGNAGEQDKKQNTEQPPRPPAEEKRKGSNQNDPNDQQPPAYAEHPPANPPLTSSRWKRFWDYFSKSEWMMVFLTAVIAATGIVGIILVIKGSEDSHKMLLAAQKQACSAQKFADTAGLINGNINAAVAKLDRQASQTKAIAEISRDALVQVQRAFVFPTPVVNLVTSDGRNLGYDVSVSWVNSGDTPTRGMTIHQSHEPMVSLPPDFSFPDLWAHGAPHTTTPAYLGARASIESGDIVFISFDELKALSASKAGIFVWGWAKYRDVFNSTKPHVSEFCYEFLPMRPPQSAVGHDKMGWSVEANNCSRHNCYDEECKAEKRQGSRRPN